MSEPVTHDGCVCNDPALDQMRQLIAGGMGQREASLIAFGIAPDHTSSRHVWSVWIRHEVLRIANTARRALGLPALPPAEVS